METLIVGVIRDLIWFLFGGWVFGLVNALWECIDWFISIIPDILASDIINTMLEYSTMIAAAIFGILLLITAIQFMINEEMQVFKRLKMIFIAGILVMGIPLIFGGLLNITTAAIADIPTIFGQESSTCMDEENNGDTSYNCDVGLGDTIANMFIETNPELKAYDQIAGTNYYDYYENLYGGDPFGKSFDDNINGGTYTCTVEECYELNMAQSTEDVTSVDWFGNEETFVFVADNLIMATITAIAVAIGLGIVIYKLFDLLIGLIIVVFWSPIKFIFFSNTHTEKFAAKYVQVVITSFLSLFLYIFSIYLCTIGMVMINEFIAASNLDSMAKILMQVISMLAFVFGGMVNGSQAFKDLFNVDTGVKSALSAYVVGKATKGAGEMVASASGAAFGNPLDVRKSAKHMRNQEKARQINEEKNAAKEAKKEEKNNSKGEGTNNNTAETGSNPFTDDIKNGQTANETGNNTFKDDINAGQTVNETGNNTFNDAGSGTEDQQTTTSGSSDMISTGSINTDPNTTNGSDTAYNGPASADASSGEALKAASVAGGAVAATNTSMSNNGTSNTPTTSNGPISTDATNGNVQTTGAGPSNNTTTSNGPISTGATNGSTHVNSNGNSNSSTTSNGPINTEAQQTNTTNSSGTTNTNVNSNEQTSVSASNGEVIKTAAVVGGTVDATNKGVSNTTTTKTETTKNANTSHQSQNNNTKTSQKNGRQQKGNTKTKQGGYRPPNVKNPGLNKNGPRPTNRRGGRK